MTLVLVWVVRWLMVLTIKIKKKLVNHGANIRPCINVHRHENSDTRFLEQPQSEARRSCMFNVFLGGVPQACLLATIHNSRSPTKVLYKNRSPSNCTTKPV